jgi:hypothetical protein
VELVARVRRMIDAGRTRPSAFSFSTESFNAAASGPHSNLRDEEHRSCQKPSCGTVAATLSGGGRSMGSREVVPVVGQKRRPTNESLRLVGGGKRSMGSREVVKAVVGEKRPTNESS